MAGDEVRDLSRVPSLSTFTVKLVSLGHGWRNTFQGCKRCRAHRSSASLFWTDIGSVLTLGKWQGGHRAAAGQGGQGAPVLQEEWRVGMGRARSQGPSMPPCCHHRGRGLSGAITRSRVLPHTCCLEMAVSSLAGCQNLPGKPACGRILKIRSGYMRTAWHAGSLGPHAGRFARKFNRRQMADVMGPHTTEETEGSPKSNALRTRVARAGRPGVTFPTPVLTSRGSNDGFHDPANKAPCLWIYG